MLNFRVVIAFIVLCFVQNLSFASISVNIERGLYVEPIKISIDTNLPNAKIKYTTDNTKPTIQKGQNYSTPIDVSVTQTIKAFAFNGSDTTTVVAHTYIFLDDVIKASYMDTVVTQNEPYSVLMKSSFFSLPAVSISSDLINVGENFEPDFEASVEMFYPDGRSAFQVNCGIETWGGSIFNLKKHYRLEFKSKYGVDELVYPLFDDVDYHIKSVNSFNRLLLRSGSQDGLNAEFCDESQALFIRNQVLFDLQIQMGYPAPHGRFVHLFVNQQYEGVYHLTERPDQDFFKDYYFQQVEKQHIEVRKNSSYLQEPIYPTYYETFTLIAQTDLSVASNFQQLTKLLDVQQTAAYILLNDYGGNFDWAADRNNLGASAPNQTYKFILWDVDLTLNNNGVFKETYGDPLSFNSLEYFGPIPETIFQNKHFKQYLADAMSCHCFNNGVLTKDQVTKTINQRAQQIEQALIAESARWGNVNFEFNGSIGHTQKNNWDVNDEWQKAKQALLNYFLAGRTDTLIKQYQEAGIYPTIKAVQFLNEKRWLRKAEKIELLNPNRLGEIYYTKDETDPQNFDGSISNKASIYQKPFAVDFATTIKARVLDNGQWSAMCPQQFYINQPYDDLIINEIHFQPFDSITITGDTIKGKYFEFIELYNKGNQAIELNKVAFNKGVKYQFKDERIEPKQFLILASDSLLFAERYNLSAFGVYDNNLSNQGETILLNNPVDQTINSIHYRLEAPWNDSQIGYSLSLKKTNLNNAEPSNWSYSLQKGGTPNQLNFIETGLINTQVNNKAQLFWNNKVNELWLVDKELTVKELDVFSIHGQLVFHKEFDLIQKSKRINLSRLPSSIYICQIKSNDEYQISKINIMQ